MYENMETEMFCLSLSVNVVHLRTCECVSHVYLSILQTDFPKYSDSVCVACLWIQIKEENVGFVCVCVVCVCVVCVCVCVLLCGL